MKVLLDHNINPRFARLLPGHQAIHAYRLGWSELVNGELIKRAESEGFDVMITADKNLRHQQNLSNRKLAIIVLDTKRISWPHIEPLAPQVNQVLMEISPGSFHVISLG